MRVQSDFVVNTLRTLERLTIDSAPARTQRIPVSASLVEMLFADLEAHVVAHDELNTPPYSEAELVFRAARLVIHTQLDQIGDAIVSMTPAVRANSGGASLWARLLDAVALAKTELHRITDIWLQSRLRDGSAASAAECTAYLRALDQAVAELQKMDEIPDIERLLYRGVASRDCVAVAAACEQILVAIQVRIDLQAARRLWTARSRWERVIGAR